MDDCMAKINSFLIPPVILASCSLTALWQSAHASAFQTFEQSAAAMGNAYAGMATTLDASAAFYNPAGMIALTVPQATAGAFYNMQRTAFAGEGEIIFPSSSIFTSIPNSSGNTQTLIPNFSVVTPTHDLPKNMHFGLSVTAPFLYETNYENAVTAWYASKTAIQTINVNPSVAINLGEKISVGAGANAQQLSIDWNALLGGNLFSQPVRYQMNGWNYGWNAGFLMELFTETYIGATYRSKITQEISGTGSNISLTSNLPNSMKVEKGTQNATSTFQLPATSSLGFRTSVKGTFNIMANVVYTQWSSMTQIAIETSQPLGGSVANIPAFFVTPLYFNNTWFIAGGIDWIVTEKWVLKGGFAYDESPVQNKYRELRIPEGDRYFLGFGLSYNANTNMVIDLGYQHIFYKDREPISNNPFIIGNAIPNTGNAIIKFSGSSNNSADVAGLQLTWRFI